MLRRGIATVQLPLLLSIASLLTTIVHASTAVIRPRRSASSPRTSKSAIIITSWPLLRQVIRRRGLGSVSNPAPSSTLAAKMPEQITLPLPSLLRSSFPPYDAQAARAAQEVLDRNHQTYHVFFNERGLHNHAAHHILAALQLGCAPSSFAQHLEKAEEYLLNPNWKLHRNPKDQGAKGSIEQHNWTEHLGKHDWYWHYLAFFESQIKEKGGAACLEEFVFGEKANEKQVAMLGRFIGGALHPLIHTGYGFEFGLDGIVAEGE